MIIAYGVRFRLRDGRALGWEIGNPLYSLIPYTAEAVAAITRERQMFQVLRICHNMTLGDILTLSDDDRRRLLQLLAPRTEPDTEDV